MTNEIGTERLTDGSSIMTRNSGEKVTLAQQIEDIGEGDRLTDFVCTEDDLLSLAYGIVDDLIAQEFYLRLCVSRRDIARCNYTEFRLSRVLDFLSEDRLTEMMERLRRGREKHDKDIQKVLESGRFPDEIDEG